VDSGSAATQKREYKLESSNTVRHDY